MSPVRSLLAAAPMALFAAAPSADDDLAAVVPIAEVIDAFKAQIRDAQAAGSEDCPLRIEAVDFTFQVARHTSFDASLGKEVTAFGVTIGGKLGAAGGREAGSVVQIAMAPDPEEDSGLFDVSGRGADFAALILHTKSQIAAAAEADPPLALARVEITTDVKITREGEAGLTLAVLDAGASAGEETSHRVVLTLAPGEVSGC